MATKTGVGQAPAGYDPSRFPAFAVTVDVVILTMSGGRLHVLLVRRGVAPYKGMWAIPGGFKRPAETLGEAAKRELAQETGVDSATLLTQFGAYGDPGRDPRMNVVTVAYLRDRNAPPAETPAAAPAKDLFGCGSAKHPFPPQPQRMSDAGKPAPQQQAAAKPAVTATGAAKKPKS